MMDDSDLDNAATVGLLSNGGGCAGSVVIIIILVVMYFVVQGNHKECEEKHCPPGHTSQLMNHTCLCVIEAKDTP